MKKLIFLIFICLVKSSYCQTPTTYINRGLVKEKSKDYAGAVAEYTKAIEMDSLSVDAYLSRGGCQIQLGNNKEALSDLNKAVRLYPTSMSYSRRAQVQFYLDDLKAAIEDCTKAIALDPNNDLAYYYRGYSKLYQDFDKAENALPDFDMAVKIDPSARNYNARGIVRNQLRMYKQAIEDFGLALPLDPSNAHTYFVRGYSRYGLGQYEEACLNWKVALILGHPNAAKVLQSSCK